MKKAYYTTLFLLFMAGGIFLSFTAPLPNPISKPKETKLGSIVRLVREGRTTCTGVVVSEDTIITAMHCVVIEGPFGPMINPSEIEIRDATNTPVSAYGKPIGARQQLDQAVIHGDFQKFAARKTITGVSELNKLAKYDVTLVACGYPLGGALHCNNLQFKELYDFFWATNGLLLPGMSGGPVMLEDGTVVALNVAVTKDKSIVSPIYNIELLYRK